jgi:head-tail adaptor
MAIRGTTIGRKDVRIQIQKRTASVNTTTSQHTYTYSTFATVWAEELGPVSSEKHEASQNVAQSVARFRVRHSHTLETYLDETCRIVRGSMTFNVTAIEPVGRKSEYVITASKRDNG